MGLFRLEDEFLDVIRGEERTIDLIHKKDEKTIVHITLDEAQTRLDDWFNQKDSHPSNWTKQNFNEHVKLYFEKIKNGYFICRSEVRSTFMTTTILDSFHVPLRRIFVFDLIDGADTFEHVFSSPPVSLEDTRRFYRKNGGRAHW